MTVTVWTLPDCRQCDMTKKVLTRHGIPHQVADLTEAPDVAERFKAAGHLSAPVVEAGEQVWSGFRPDLIKELAA